jgi:FkbM family methyltransferase
VAKPVTLNQIRAVLPDRLFYQLNSYRYRYGLEPEVQFLPQMVPAGALALDIGAAWGSFSFWLGKSTRRIIAFEPNPDLVTYLRRVLPANVEVRGEAISDCSGTAQLLIPRHGSNPYELASLEPDNPATDDAEPVTVTTVTLDDLDLGAIAFVKIDVEGHEERALDGGARLLEEQAPNLLIELEERHNPGSVYRVADRLRASGYAGWFWYEREWRPVEHFDVTLHQNADTTSVKSRRYCNNFYFSRAVPSFVSGG